MLYNINRPLGNKYLFHCQLGFYITENSKNVTRRGNKSLLLIRQLIIRLELGDVKIRKKCHLCHLQNSNFKQYNRHKGGNINVHWRW